MNIKRIFSIVMLGSLMLAVVPSAVSADSGPSITVAPTCPPPSYVSGEYYSYYDTVADICRYGPSSGRTAARVVNNSDDSALSGLGSIKFPTFMSLDQINHFSIWSYVSLIVSLVFVLLVIFWVLTLVRAGIAWMHSLGDPATIQGAQRKVTSVFAGVVFLIGFFVGINIVAGFIGIGNFSEWPKVFSICRDGGYYYNYKLDHPDLNESQVDAACLGGQ